MDEKVFSLLEKMYGEMENGFKEVREEIKEVKHNVVRFEDKMENQINVQNHMQEKSKERWDIYANR